MMSLAGGQPTGDASYPKPASPAGWTDPLPVPTTPPDQRYLGPREGPWLIYFGLVVLLATAAFLGIWWSGANPSVAEPTAAADVTQ